MTLRLALALVLLLGSASPARGQVERPEGALLGLFSGTVWGSIGSFYPCSRQARVLACRVGVIGAHATISGLGGALLGDDRGATDAAFRRSAWTGLGFGLVGGGLVVAGSRLITSWKDFLALEAIGIALGGPIAGVGIGFGVGALVEAFRAGLGGGGGWLDVAEGGILGAAVGATAWWILRGAAAQRADRAVAFGVSVPVP